MLATCPKCAHRVVVDDAKAPDRAFTVKCPKCQTPVKFAGKAAHVAASPAAATIVPGAELPSASGAATGTGADSQDMRAGMMAMPRMSGGVTGPMGVPMCAGRVATVPETAQRHGCQAGGAQQ